MTLRKSKRQTTPANRKMVVPDDSRLGLQVGDLMRVKMVTCRAEASAIEVAQIMMVHRIRYCLVLNKQDELIGIIAARSLQRAAGSRLEQTLAEDVMLPCVVIAVNQPIEQAAAKMYLNHLQHLVVLSDRPGSQAVLGIVGATDILKQVTARKGGK